MLFLRCLHLQHQSLQICMYGCMFDLYNKGLVRNLILFLISNEIYMSKLLAMTDLREAHLTPPGPIIFFQFHAVWKIWQNRMLPPPAYILLVSTYVVCRRLYVMHQQVCCILKWTVNVCQNFVVELFVVTWWCATSFRFPWEYYLLGVSVFLGQVWRPFWLLRRHHIVTTM